MSLISKEKHHPPQKTSEEMVCVPLNEEMVIVRATYPGNAACRSTGNVPTINKEMICH